MSSTRIRSMWPCLCEAQEQCGLHISNDADMHVHLWTPGLGRVLQLMNHCQGHSSTLMIDIIANGSYLVESGLKMKHVVFWGYNSRLMSVKGLGPPPELCGLSVQSFQVINKWQNMIYKRCFYTWSWHEHLLPLHQERVRTWCSPTVMRSVALTCWRVNTHRSFPLWRTQWPWT